MADNRTSSNNESNTDGESESPLKATAASTGSKVKLTPVAQLYAPTHFDSELHFYPRVLNATIHPLVASFFTLGNKRIIARYCHLNPQVSEESLERILNYKCQYFQWAGSDLFHVTTNNGQRQMIIVETNSCPSGQKSMPLLADNEEHGGYSVIINRLFKDISEKADQTLGDLAVIYDKNSMEATGYASVMYENLKEKVWLVEFYNGATDPPVKWVDGVLFVRDEAGNWHSIRACFRYVTQKPWNRFPLKSRTLVLNPIISCLAGGRNKMMAARAYEFYNAELGPTGLSIRMPDTIHNVSKDEIPLWLNSMGGHAVVKIPYSNAGQGVYTILSKKELDDFMSKQHHYGKYIVQSLVGNARWSSITRTGQFYHVGTIPNTRNETYACDIRMMVVSTESGFRPVAIYARRARKPLVQVLDQDNAEHSWEMLGTNLSVKIGDEWSTETNRLMLMDRKDFAQLGISVDDLIDAYVQTALAVIAIDKMCKKLVPDDQGLDFKLFKALNPDPALLNEIMKD